MCHPQNHLGQGLNFEKLTNYRYNQIENMLKIEWS